MRAVSASAKVWTDEKGCADGIKFVVLDEADKMLSLGLQPQLYRLRKLLLPAKRKGAEDASLILAPHRRRPQV